MLSQYQKSVILSLSAASHHKGTDKVAEAIVAPTIIVISPFHSGSSDF